MADVSKTFVLLLKSGQQLYCLDPDGGKRWFDEKRYRLLVDDKTVTVTMDESEWQKRADRDADYRSVSCAKMKRKCLRCSQPKLMDKNQYICWDCKNRRGSGSNDYMGHVV